MSGSTRWGPIADRLGLSDTLSARIPPPRERFWLHDRGKVLVQTMSMLAGGRRGLH